MPTSRRLRTLLLLCTAPLLSACTTQPAPAPARAGRERAAEAAPAAAPKAPAPATARPAGNQPVLMLSSNQGRPGEAVNVTATLTTAGASIAGTQNDIGFDPTQISVAAKANGKPDCTPNRELGKEGTAFSFLPPRCQKQTCSGVRALVLSLSNVAPIANNSILYTCKVAIAPQATAGSHQLSVSNAGFSNPTGQSIVGSSVGGTISVGK